MFRPTFFGGGGEGWPFYKTISCFADQIGATLTVMKGGEHWFHNGQSDGIP